MLTQPQLYAVLNQNNTPEKMESVLILSRGTAIILLILYAMYLVFQLRTHSNLFDSENQESEDEEEEVGMGAIAAACVLVVTTVLVAVCADYLVGSIDEIVASTNISKAFIGLILIPIVGNAAEHVTAVVVALRDKMDLAMGVAIGSSIQIALGVTPFLVIVGWIIGQPMSLHFETCKSLPTRCRTMSLTACSPNRRVCRVCPSRYVYRAGRQVQLPRRRYASGSVPDYCCGILRYTW